MSSVMGFWFRTRALNAQCSFCGLFIDLYRPQSQPAAMGKPVVPNNDPQRLAKMQNERLRMIGVSVRGPAARITRRRVNRGPDEPPPPTVAACASGTAPLRHPPLLTPHSANHARLCTDPCTGGQGGAGRPSAGAPGAGGA